MTTDTLSAWDAGTLPWVPAGGVRGARVRTLWASPGSRATLVLLEAGAAFPVHVHPAAEHHAFVVEGRCRVGDRLLDAGSYVHVPAGEPHDLCGAEPAGATVFYVVERGAP